jgi:hypothetical protein
MESADWSVRLWRVRGSNQRFFLEGERMEEKGKVKRAVISQPMKGKTGEQIRAERTEIVEQLEGRGYEVVDTVFPGFIDQGLPLKHLAKTLETIAGADLVVFMPGWEQARGCRIEHTACAEYGIHFEELCADQGKREHGKKMDFPGHEEAIAVMDRAKEELEKMGFYIQLKAEEKAFKTSGGMGNHIVQIELEASKTISTEH